MKENLENKVEFEYSVPNMDSIIEYMYTGDMELKEDNITEITNISCYLQVYIIQLSYIYFFLIIQL